MGNERVEPFEFITSKFGNTDRGEKGRLYKCVFSTHGHIFNSQAYFQFHRRFSSDNGINDAHSGINECQNGKNDAQIDLNQSQNEISPDDLDRNQFDDRKNKSQNRKSPFNIDLNQGENEKT